jgi:cell division protein FtsQ
MTAMYTDAPQSQAQQGHTTTDTGFARLDPRASRAKYRMERLMLTPLFRFSLRVVLPFTICFGTATAWFAVDDNRAAFQSMIAEARDAVENRPEFQVKLMAIDGATPGVAETIRATLPVNFPISSFDLDLDEMQTKLIALDPVKSAQLRIRPGGVLQVDVVERVPALLWRAEDGLKLLDLKGVLVGRAKHRPEHADLPVMAGDILSPDQADALALPVADRTVDEQALAEEAQAILASASAQVQRLWQASGPLQSRVRGFERQGARRWDVVLDRGQRVMLPEMEPLQAWERVIAMALAPQVDMLSRDLVVVDLRLPRRPVIRMSEHATENMWQLKRIEAGLE